MLKVIDKDLEEICSPKKGTEYSACVDLFAAKDVVVAAGETVLVPLGVKIDKDCFKKIVSENFYYNDCNKKNFQDTTIHFMKTHQLNLHIRSSMSAKHGLIIANGTGIIDLDYPGEIMICLHNPIRQKWTSLEDGEPYDEFQNSVEIKKGDKIAQISLVEHKTYLLGVESEEKRVGGLGSTGK